jgi:23S rRNA (cytosine1962-C5)-methyltransferase
MKSNQPGPAARPAERGRPVAVTLKKPIEAQVRAGHPWVFRDALATPPRLRDGATVVLRARDRRPLGLGFWDAHSPIAVRLLTEKLGGDGDLGRLVTDRLGTALARRLEQLAPAATNAFRWVHGEADRLPGLHVDLYADVAAVRFDGAGARAFYRDLPARLQAGRAAAQAPPLQAIIDREGRKLMDGRAVTELEVRENGLTFVVDLVRGQKGGLFLDQRDNRAEVGRRAQARSVLNLFGYTGGFSLYAAAGGARRTDTVDVARPALEAARRNFTRNGLPVDRERTGLHAQDAFEFLAAAATRGDRWDIVISDPPSFAPRHSALPAARRAYRRLHQMAAAVTAPGGTFCPASCSSHFSRDEFMASVEDGVRAAGRKFRLQSLRGAGFDHPVVPWFPEGDYLKFAILALL